MKHQTWNELRDTALGLIADAENDLARAKAQLNDKDLAEHFANIGERTAGVEGDDDEETNVAIEELTNLFDTIQGAMKEVKGDLERGADDIADHL